MSDSLDAVRDELRMIKRAKRDARSLWLVVRKESGQTRFTDPGALRGIDVAVERCIGRVQWRDIESAIRENGALAYARSPWYLDSWALQAMTTREEKERADLPMSVKLAALKAARR